MSRFIDAPMYVYQKGTNPIFWTRSYHPQSVVAKRVFPHRFHLATESDGPGVEEVSVYKRNKLPLISVRLLHKACLSVDEKHYKVLIRSSFKDSSST